MPDPEPRDGANDIGLSDEGESVALGSLALDGPHEGAFVEVTSQLCHHGPARPHIGFRFRQTHPAHGGLRYQGSVTLSS